MLSARGPIRPNMYRTSFSSAVGRPARGKERAFFGFVDTAEDSRDYMREVPDGADGFKRLADAALAASCATLSPNTADPCLVARLAAESRERSRSLTDPGTQARGAKRAAGSSARDGAAGRGPAL